MCHLTFSLVKEHKIGHFVGLGSPVIRSQKGFGKSVSLINTRLWRRGEQSSLLQVHTAVEAAASHGSKLQTRFQ